MSFHRYSGFPLFFLSFAVSLSAQPQPGAVPQPAVNLGSIGYSAVAGNPFDFGDGTFQCTRYAWGRAFEKTGVRIQFSQSSGRDGGQWLRLVTGLHTGSSPRPNSIAVWSGGTGHVAFVESVDNDNVKISEANYSSYPNARYDGYRTLTSDQMKQRGSLVLVGYIYLNNYEGYIDAVTPDCRVVSGWGANRDTLNSSVTVDIYESTNTYLGSVYALAIRQDVGNYLGDNGYHGFAFALPDWLRDGRNHYIWARFSRTNIDLMNSKPIACGGSSQLGNLQLTFSPTSVLPTANAPCSPTYEFSLSGREIGGGSLDFSTLALSEGWSWSLPFLSIPSHLGPYETFQTSLSWCRGPGQSTWTISGTDQKGNARSASATIDFRIQ